MRNPAAVVPPLLLSLFIALHPASAQQDEADPLAGNYVLGNSAEIVMLWSESSSSDGDGDASQKIYDFLSLNNPDILDDLEPSAKQQETGSLGFGWEKAMDVVTGDLNGDNADDLASVWEGPNRSINMIIPEIDGGSLSWSESNATTIEPAETLVGDDHQSMRQVRIVGGYFDEDPQMELLLAYWAADASIQLKVYDTNGTLTPAEQGGIADASMPYDGSGMLYRSARFDVNTGDFDGDGTDEVVLVWGAPLDGSSEAFDWQMNLRVYDVEDGMLTPTADAVVFPKDNRLNEYLSRVAVESGDFDGDVIDELALGFHVAATSGTSYWYLHLVEIGEDLKSVNLDFSERETVQSTTGNSGYPMSVVAEDLNEDGRPEAVMAAYSLDIYEAVPDTVSADTVSTNPLEIDYDIRMELDLLSTASIGTESGNGSRRVLAVADLDADVNLANDESSWRPEIVVGRHITSSGLDDDSTYELRVFEYTPGEFNLTLRGALQDESSDENNHRPFALAVGDFGASGIRVGTPKRYSRTEIVQPLVVLNAPPVHYDRFDGIGYDVNDCFNPDPRFDCEFIATYETEAEQTIETTAEVHRDWTTSIEAGGGFSVLGIGVEAKLRASYGEGFSKSSRERETFTVSRSTAATVDDWIYATVKDYDIWEYPVLVGGETEGHIAVVVPGPITLALFPSKAPSARGYVPAHEVGNILSYLDIAAPGENTALDEEIRWSTGDRVTLNDNTDYTWALTQENETETVVTRDVNRSIGASLDFDIPVPFIPNFSLSGDYADQSVSTHRMNVRDRRGLTVQLSGIDLGIGQTFYQVTPYAYWAKTGSLVLDYAVRPELADTGEPETWWQAHYGQDSDPAFILPWRYDPEKGIALDDESLRTRSPDILFDPAEPAPGQEVTVRVRVHNFSLLPTPGPVSVRLWVGDPENGGTPVTSTGGEDVFLSAGPIAARGRQTLSLQWRVPSDIDPSATRVYATLDDEDAIAEVHTNNNIGWTVLRPGDAVTIDDPPVEQPAPAYLLHPNYPNPFDGSTTISYSLPRAEDVRLTVYDMLGREVATLVDGRQAAGQHEAVLALPLASGVYVYRLEAGPFRVTRTMVVRSDD